MGKKFKQEEIDYIAAHYPIEGPAVVGKHLDRPRGSIRLKAKEMGLSYVSTRKILAEERKKTESLRHKADTTVNENPEVLNEIMRTRRVMDDGKVSVRFDSKTIILMDAAKATPEHIARLRERMGKAMRA